MDRMQPEMDDEDLKEDLVMEDAIYEEEEEEEEEDMTLLKIKEPSSKAILFWALMVIFGLLILICTALSILFATPLLQETIPDATPNRTTASFFVPSEAIFASLTAGFLALFVVAFLYMRVLNTPCGVQEKKGRKMFQISNFIAQGARAFLFREFQFIALFVVIGFAVLFAFDQSFYYVPTPICFVIGALTSGTTSIIGMSIATSANVRTANSARHGLNSALRVAFNAGSVMGLSVVGLGLIAVSVFYLVFRDLAALAGLGFGASSIALFARVGGGIFTKAADVGADLVGKVESNIPEDDPRNPAVIADNVGDNVGDVAGMGADLFESYVGTIIAAMTLGADFFGARGVACPLYLSAGGILCSIIGSALVATSDKTKKGQDIQDKLLWAIRRGIYGAACLNVLIGALVIFLLFDFAEQAWQLFFCYVIGLVAGVLIGVATEFCTSFSYRPTRSIAESGVTGSAPVVIKGLSVGMLSTIAPVFIIFLSIIGAVLLGDMTAEGAGIYGISIAAVGMLSTLGVTLATDAYGPIADNAGGIAEMAGLPAEVRERTDALDALGNTTAATGKGFAIGSAVLTALALMNAYTRASGITTVNVLEFQVMCGLLLGACLPFVFAALTMTAVSDAAMSIIVEVRRQFKSIPGLLEGNTGAVADHKKCVSIATNSALKKMIIPGLMTVAAPIVIGFAGRQKMLAGLLAGAIVSGFVLAVTMANAGGAWDNAKKYIEAGSLVDPETGDVLGKGSEPHKAAVVGDTIGDPFKDTSGPSLNILIKLMTVVSLVLGPVLKSVYPEA